MAAEEGEVRVQFRARYFRSGVLNQHTKHIWIVLHGYGQLAEYFIRKFHILDNGATFILAPEGLSRFYLSELTDAGRKDNKVGATWMTRENRQMDIDNYITYLHEVYRKELSGFNHVPVTVLAFSQGCATACRWVTQGVRFDRLILWAGLFPPDMDFESGHHALQDKKTIMVVGNQDPYVTPERMVEFDALALKLGIAPQKVIFNGKHEINEEVLRKLAL